MADGSFRLNCVQAEAWRIVSYPAELACYTYLVIKPETSTVVATLSPVCPPRHISFQQSALFCVFRLQSEANDVRQSCEVNNKLRIEPRVEKTFA